MLKRIAQVSALALILPMTAALPAGAATWSGGSEEDAAAPQGSFTSDMSVPMQPGRSAHHVQWRHNSHHFMRP